MYKQVETQRVEGERWAMTLVEEHQFAHEPPRSVERSPEVVLSEFIRKGRQGLAKQIRRLMCRALVHVCRQIRNDEPGKCRVR